MSEEKIEDQLRRLYHEQIGEKAEAFAHGIEEIISTNIVSGNLQKSDITVLGIKIHEDDLYPNDYATLLLAVLDAKSYTTASYKLNVNGHGDMIETIPKDIISGRLSIVVDIHQSRVFGNYLQKLKDLGASEVLYACPPENLWTYQEGKLVHLRKQGV